jgi:fermentation-respiration switch protein FrsA (DUF1100 family)
MLTPAALEILGTPEAAKEMLVQQIATEWFRYFLHYDPAVVFSRITVPVLAINGSLDRQVPADENLAAIAAALAHNPNVTIRKLEGLNHLFQRATTGALGSTRIWPKPSRPHRSALSPSGSWRGSDATGGRNVRRPGGECTVQAAEGDEC